MAPLRLLPLIALACALFVACGGDDGDSGEPTLTPTAPGAPTATVPATPTVGPLATPNVPQATDLSLPAGFTAYNIADDLSAPTSLALGAGGELYVSQLNAPVVRLTDADGDGSFESKTEYVDGVRNVDGIALGPDGALYISWRTDRGGQTGMVTAARDADGDTVAESKTDVITGLPNGNHQNNGLAFDAAGKLYVTNGSTCNDCVEADERSAAILQANADGSELRVYASGLRNSYDLTFDDQGRLWATDNGSDPPCNTTDELNMIVDGGDYGWPYSPACDNLSAQITPVANLGLNTCATGVTFYDGDQFPDEYKGNFFVTLCGSNPFIDPPQGKLLVRVVIDESSGEPTGEMHEFASGFGRPVDVVMDRDGTLLLLDLDRGRLIRIVYTGS
jgi:glucose/arabinose dehydrogenase